MRSGLYEVWYLFSSLKVLFEQVLHPEPLQGGGPDQLAVVHMELI